MGPRPENEIISNTQTDKKKTSSLTYTINDFLFSIAQIFVPNTFDFSELLSTFGWSATVGLPPKLAIYLPPKDLQSSSPEEPNQTNTLRYLILDTKLTRILREHAPVEPHSEKSKNFLAHSEKKTPKSTWNSLTIHTLKICTQSSRTREIPHSRSRLLCKTFFLLCRSYGSSANPNKSTRKE